MNHSLKEKIAATPMLQNIFQLPIDDLKNAIFIMKELSTLSDEDLQDVIDIYKTQNESSVPFDKYYANRTKKVS